jgi:hypothetical protein
MPLKRVFMLAASALAIACLVNAGPAIRDAGAQQAPKQETLSETYRITRANDVEFQKIAPFKVFDNLYHVGPGYVGVGSFRRRRESSIDPRRTVCRLRQTTSRRSAST